MNALQKAMLEILGDITVLSCSGVPVPAECHIVPRPRPSHSHVAQCGPPVPPGLCFPDTGRLEKMHPWHLKEH